MKEYRAIAKIYKAFCDENRLKILDILSHGERCACVLLDDLNIAQSTLSHHMKILCDSGIVVGRKEGKWMHYSLSENDCLQAAQYITALTNREQTQQAASC